MQCVVYSNSPRDWAMAVGAANRQQVRTVMSARMMNVHLLGGLEGAGHESFLPLDRQFVVNAVGAVRGTRNLECLIDLRLVVEHSDHLTSPLSVTTVMSKLLRPISN